MTERYAGLLDHLERHLGEAREYEEPTATGRNRGYGLTFCYTANDLVSVITNGLRFQRVTAIMPQELLCTVHADQRRAAHLLVPLTAGIVLERGAGLVPDEVLLSADPDPVVPDTRIAGVLAAVHPYAPEEFNELVGADGKVELELMTLLPCTRPELLLAQQAGADALYDAWEARNTDLLDMYRASAV